MPLSGEIRSIKLNGRLITYRVRVSGRTRRVQLRVCWSGLEVTVPLGMRVQGMERTLRAAADWILKHLDAATKVPESPRVFVRGRELDVRVHAGEPRVELSDGLLTVWTYRDQLPMNVLGNWLIDQAGDDIMARLEHHGKKMNVSWRMVYIKDQKSRWGSCSALGNLNFCFRLVMAPPEVLDYVAVHELAHLVHPNHSKAYWNLVARHCPEYKKHLAWLKKHGNELQVPLLPKVDVARPPAPPRVERPRPPAPRLQLDLGL
jgi:predicted metal-dependent hydrolase